MDELMANDTLCCFIGVFSFIISILVIVFNRDENKHFTYKGKLGITYIIPKTDAGNHMYNIIKQNEREFEEYYTHLYDDKGNEKDNRIITSIVDGLSKSIHKETN